MVSSHLYSVFQKPDFNLNALALIIQSQESCSDSSAEWPRKKKRQAFGAASSGTEEWENFLQAYLSSESISCGAVFACASIAIADCCKI